MPHRPDQRLSDRTLTDVVVLLLVAALAFQGLQPLPPFLLGMAIACGLVVGFIPQTGWWLAVVRAIVGVGPISYVVAGHYKGAALRVIQLGFPVARRSLRPAR
ncbi:MAG: hypothetical protein AAB409_07755 [Gemmatimonadota bacterium]